jgi:hypothetical protein
MNLKKQCVEGCTPWFLTLGAYEEREVKLLDLQQYSGERTHRFRRQVKLELSG